MNRAPKKRQLRQQRLAAFRFKFTHAGAIATKEGVKDTVHEIWLLLIKSKMAELQGQDGLLDQDTLLKQMQSWFDEQPGMKENPFLHLEGECCCILGENVY